MEAVKTVLAGCGALALLSLVGCVGLVGASSYAVDQALDEQEVSPNTSKSPPSRDGNRSGSGSRFDDDPFSDYDSGADIDADGAQVGGWSDESK